MSKKKNKKATINNKKKQIKKVEANRSYKLKKDPETKEIVYRESANLILTENFELKINGTNNMNSIIIASVGSGKTRGICKSNLLQKGCSFVVTDVKGDIVNEFGAYLESSQGPEMPSYKIKVIDLKNPETSAKYNPFKYIHTDVDIVNFASAVMSELNNGNDNYWVTSAQTLLLACIYYVIETNPIETRNMNSVLKFFNNTISQGQEYVEDLFKMLPVDSKSNTYYRKIKTSDRTWDCIVGELGVALSRFEYPEIQDFLSDDEINLDEIMDERTALFIILDDTNPAFDFIAGIIYTQLFRILYKKADNMPGSKLDTHVRFIMDDFANYRVPNIDKIVSAARSRNISLQFILQSESQLYDIYGNMAANIIANCTYVYIAGNDIRTEDSIGRRLGISTKEVQDMVGKTIITFPEGITVTDKKADYLKHPYYPLLKEYPVKRKYSFPGEKQDYCRKEADIVEFKRPESVEENTKIAFDILGVSEKTFTKICDGIKLRKDKFDSNEEQLFYDNVLAPVVDFLNEERKVSNKMIIKIHTSLRDIFDTHVMEKVSQKVMWKLINMHCDFLICDERDFPLFGVEIDGTQHIADADQEMNDRLKDFFFTQAGIPLYRFTAKDVRSNPEGLRTTLKNNLLGNGIERLIEAITPVETYDDDEEVEVVTLDETLKYTLSDPTEEQEAILNEEKKKLEEN